MHAESYKSKGGSKLFRPVLDGEDNLFDMDNMGFCLSCGEEAFGVEPDARRYTCDCCGKPMVYGLEELLLMGILQTEGAD
jgi:hypothetical protein